MPLILLYVLLSCSLTSLAKAQPAYRWQYGLDASGAVSQPDDPRIVWQNYPKDGSSFNMNFGFVTGALWLRATTDKSQGDKEPLFVVVDYPLLDHVTAFRQQADGRYQTAGRSGDMVAMREKTFPLRQPVFHLGKDNGFALRLQTQGSMQVPISVETTYSLASMVSHEQLAFGIYYGALLVMIAYNLILAFFTRDAAYLWYSSYAASYFFFQSVVNGLAGTMFWPNLPFLSNYALNFFGALAFFFIIGFFCRFVRLSQHAPHWHRVLRLWAKACLVLAFISIISDYNTAVRIVILNSYGVSIGLFLLAIRLVMKGHQEARVFLTAWTIFLAGIVILGLKNHGLLPTQFWTTYAVQIGSFLEFTLLGMALGQKIRDEQRRRYEVEKEKNAAEARLRAYAALAKATQSVAHDVRRPFSMLKSLLTCLADERDPQEIKAAAKRFLPEVNKSIDRVNLMLSDVMHMDGGLRKSKWAAKDLFAAAIRDFNTYAKGHHMRVQVQTEDHLVGYGDWEKMQRVIANLMHNAAQATKGSGTLTLSASACKQDLLITVHNTESYIEEAERKKVFDPFFTKNKANGTGLGLAICQRIVAQHGGNITCDSHHDAGTQFAFTLPISC